MPAVGPEGRTDSDMEHESAATDKGHLAALTTGCCDPLDGKARWTPDRP